MRAVNGHVSPICVTGLVRIAERRTTSATGRRAGRGRLNVDGGPAKRRRWFVGVCHPTIGDVERIL